jgi:hypothetical protein
MKTYLTVIALLFFGMQAKANIFTVDEAFTTQFAYLEQADEQLAQGQRPILDTPAPLPSPTPSLGLLPEALTTVFVLTQGPVGGIIAVVLVYYIAKQRGLNPEKEATSALLTCIGVHTACAVTGYITGSILLFWSLGWQ